MDLVPTIFKSLFLPVSVTYGSAELNFGPFSASAEAPTPQHTLSLSISFKFCAQGDNGGNFLSKMPVHSLLPLWSGPPSGELFLPLHLVQLPTYMRNSLFFQPIKGIMSQFFDLRI